MMMTTMMMMMMRYKLVLPQFMIFPRRMRLPLGQVRASSEGAALHFGLSQFVIDSSHSSVKPHENAFYVRSGAFCS